jgi:hypothetical protein
MSLFDTAISGALGTIRQICGNPVAYLQGGTTPIDQPSIRAGIAATEWELDDGGTVVETWTSRDYLIAASDLTVGGKLITPAKGDQINETINSIPRTFEVMAPQGKPVFSFSDRGMTQLRVHTKEVA